jgi:hypothetical protein
MEEEGFSPQKRTLSTSNMKNLKNFYFCGGNFCPPGCGFGSGSTDLIESGSNTDPDLKQVLVQMGDSPVSPESISLPAGPPAYVDWRAGTTTLCRSQHYPPRQRL